MKKPSPNADQFRSDPSMDYRLDPSAPVGEEIKRILHIQVAGATTGLRSRKAVLSDRIHDGRTACKKIRAAVALAGSPRRAGREIERLARDCARELSALREATVMTTTLGHLIEGSNGKSPKGALVIHRLIWAQRREAFADRQAIERVLAGAAVRLGAIRRHLAPALDRRLSLKAIIRAYADSYRRARREFRKDYAYGLPMHRWRKRTKTLSHHCALLVLLRPELMKAWRHELSSLDDILGEEHDLQRLDEVLRERRKGAPAEDIHAFRQAIKARRSDLRRRASRLGGLIFSGRPSQMQRNLRAWAKLASDPMKADGSNGEGG